MIGKLTGTLLEKDPRGAAGLPRRGLRVQKMPMSTFYNLPECGRAREPAHQFIVREDAQLLWLCQHERQAFRRLIKISGVGPHGAVHPLGPGRARPGAGHCRCKGGRLVKVPGIGKENRRAPAAELKGKLGADIGVRPASSDNQADILQALLALGYNDKEASHRPQSPAARVGVSDGINWR